MKGEYMIGTCSKCGSHKWNKTVKDGKVFCSDCGHSWSFKSLPLFVLSGCSGIGKTTTAIEIMHKTDDIIVLDADVFCGIQNAVSEDDYRSRMDTIEWLSRNINQSGKPVLWTIAGNLDMLHESYNSRFFSDIYCLALVADESEIRDRMTKGRGITDQGWIEGSVGYNEYFKTHNSVGKTNIETLDTSHKSPSQVADEVISWVNKILKK